MNKDRQEQIAARAYQLWEEEGRPHGAHERHWEQASRDVNATDEAKPTARAKTKIASTPRKAPLKADKPSSPRKAPKAATPVRAAAAKVEGDAGDKLSTPAGKTRMR
jgi:hypothetical protein